jgi:hypothetical protein
MNVLPLVMTLSTHKNCWDAPSSWTLRKTVRGSTPASSNAFPTTSPTSAVQTIVKFRISVNEDEYEEIITYNKLMDFIEKNQENDAIVWQF